MAVNKVSHDSDYLDFGKLEKEIQNAVVSEERYWQENDAKIRAVEQRVPTYDDFREMVLAAHLKPLEKKDKLSSIEKFTQVWNPSAQKFSKSQGIKEQTHLNAQEEPREQNKLEKESAMKLPGSGTEFVLHWRHHCRTQEDKKNFLFTVGAQKLAKIFKVEIDGDLLGEFLECLRCLEDNKAAQAVEILETLTKSQRFSLSLAFLSKKEKESCRLLFTELKTCPTTHRVCYSARMLKLGVSEQQAQVQVTVLHCAEAVKRSQIACIRAERLISELLCPHWDSTT